MQIAHPEQPDLRATCFETIQITTDEVLSCTLTATPSSGNRPLTTTFALTMSTGAVLDYINYGNGSTGTTLSKIYNNVGSYTATGYVSNPNNPDDVVECRATITVSE